MHTEICIDGDTRAGEVTHHPDDEDHYHDPIHFTPFKPHLHTSNKVIETSYWLYPYLSMDFCVSLSYVIHMSTILDHLTKAQAKAVTFAGPALMIVAGAGTGKTTTLTRRIAWLVEHEVAPQKILALAFNEKAVAEMEMRVDQLLPYGVFGVEISTFHSFCHKILQKYPIYSQVSESHVLLTEASQKLFFNNHIEEFGQSSLRPLSNLGINTVETLRFINRCKDELISPETLSKWVIKTDNEDKNLYTELAKVYVQYQALLSIHHLLDYGELLYRTYEMLNVHQALCYKIQNTFSHILIDEYQDTNRAQIEIIKQLYSHKQSITVVGDDDQAIYRFRGATTGQMTTFAHDFKAKTILLNDNFRSGQKILDTAYTLIQHNNPYRLESSLKLSKKLTSHLDVPGEVLLKSFQTDEKEAEWIASDIIAHNKNNVDWDNFCVLTRTNKQTQIFAEFFRILNIPFTTESNLGLNLNPTIRIMLNYLKCVADPHNSQALFFLAGSPAYNISGSGLTPMFATSRTTFEPLEELLVNVPEAEKLLSDLNLARDAVPNVTVRQLIEMWLKSHPMWVQVYHQAETEPERLAINQFLQILHQFERVAPFANLFAFLDQVETLLDDYANLGSDSDKFGLVRLYTAHQAKGLEFTHVYITNLTKDRFPLIDRANGFSVPADLVMDKPVEGEHLREERRLFYVAATRAKHRLILTHANIYGATKPRPSSPFLADAGFINNIDNEPNQGKNLPKSPIALPQKQKETTTSLSISLSPHALVSYDDCPLKYHYQFIDRIPTGDNSNAMIGQCVHAAIEHYFKMRTENKLVKLDELTALIDTGWLSRGFNSLNHEKARKLAAYQQISHFMRRFDSLTLPKYTEYDFSIMIDQAKLRGRIDAIFTTSLPGAPPDSKICIVDFKTSDNVLDQKKADDRATNSLQLRLYSLAYEELTGSAPDAVGLYFPASDLFGWTIPTTRKLANTREKVTSIVAEIQSNHFSATPSAYKCGVCPFNAICSFSEA